MSQPIGGPRLSNTSSNSDFLAKPSVHLALLFGAGMFIALMHQVFHWPLKMPGHHGLEMMAITMFARCASGNRYAATTTSLGNVLVSSFFTHEMLIQQVILVLQGLFIDSVYPKLRQLQDSQSQSKLKLQIWVACMALLAGCAHAIKPLFKWLMQLSVDIHAGSLVNGLAYPLMSHILFGAVGGMAGTLAWQSYLNIKKK